MDVLNVAEIGFFVITAAFAVLYCVAFTINHWEDIWQPLVFLLVFGALCYGVGLVVINLGFG